MRKKLVLGIVIVTSFDLGSVGVVGADPLGDAASIWSIQDENASLSSAHLTDRYYVNGLRISYTSPTGAVPNMLADFGTSVWGDGQQRISITVAQQIFTPANTQAKPPLPGDEPYAGYLIGTASLIHDGVNTRSTLGVSLGIIGPAAGGEEVQNGFHGIISQGTNKAWNYQLHTEPAVQFLGDRVWRLPVRQFNIAGGLEMDALPEVQAQVGTVQDYVLAGFNVRFGQGLTSDYGVPRLSPGPSGADVFQPTRPLAWYVFAGVDGQAVAHNEFLQGSNFRTSPHVTMKPIFGEVQGGLAIIYHGVRLSYTQVFQSTTFKGEHGGLHQFGSLALSARF